MLKLTGVKIPFLSGKDDPLHDVVAESWLAENVWRVQSFKQLKNGDYDIYYLDIQQPTEATFEDLLYTVEHVEYSSFNSYNLSDGVNCQGMVDYIANWCDINYYPYSVAWTATHVFIYVLNVREASDLSTDSSIDSSTNSEASASAGASNGQWYYIDFDISGTTIQKVEEKDVLKGRVENEPEY